jgi:hypothetical protein
MAGKWLELLTEIAPGIKRAAIIFNPDTAPGSDTLAETRNSFSPAVCLQTSRLRGFGAEVLSD